MGTVLLDKLNPRRYIKRFYGGDNRGVCYSVEINDEFTEKELVDLVGEITFVLLQKVDSL